MGEQTAEIESTRTELAEEKLAKQFSKLFGVTTSGLYPALEEGVDLQNSDELKKAVAGVLSAAIEFSNSSWADKGKQKKDLKLKDFFKPEDTQLDHDASVNSLEMALGVVNGERADSEVLIKAVGSMVDATRKGAGVSRRKEEAGIPNRGFLGLGGPDQYEASRINTKYEQIDARAKAVLERVSELAPVWARKD